MNLLVSATGIVQRLWYVMTLFSNRGHGIAALTTSRVCVSKYIHQCYFFFLHVASERVLHADMTQVTAREQYTFQSHVHLLVALNNTGYDTFV